MKFFLAVVLVAVGTQAKIFDKAGPAWDGLRITWNPNPFGTYAFNAMPRTVAETAKEGFSLKDSFCGDDRRFRGNRYRIKNNPDLTLIYDVAGYIAGVQTCVPKSALTPPPAQVGNPFIEDGDCWALTAYFVDPNIICTTGRTAQQFLDQGTGDRVVIQNGSDATTGGYRVPMTEEGNQGTLWKKGKCLWTMGLHYWYNSRTDMDCKEWFPYFLLYNKGKLNSFGFAPPANWKLSDRYEHPTNFQAKSCCLEPFPDCFYTAPEFETANTMHVYLIDSPRTSNFC